jgi:hypothetical protein
MDLICIVCVLKGEIKALATEIPMYLKKLPKVNSHPNSHPKGGNSSHLVTLFREKEEVPSDRLGHPNFCHSIITFKTLLIICLGETHGGWVEFYSKPGGRCYDF